MNDINIFRKKVDMLVFGTYVMFSYYNKSLSEIDRAKRDETLRDFYYARLNNKTKVVRVRKKR